MRLTGCLFAISDGEGEREGGIQAARVAVERILERYYALADSLGAAESLAAGLRSANRAVVDIARTREDFANVSASLAAAVLRDQSLVIVSAGTSRVILIRNGEPLALTVGHPANDEPAPALGLEPDLSLPIPPALKVRRGDVLVLCTDGLYEVVEDAAIARIAKSAGPQEAAERLVALANGRAGRDNMTVVVVAIGQLAVVPSALRARGLKGISATETRTYARPALAGLVVLASLWALALLVSHLPTPGVLSAIPGRSIPRSAHMATLTAIAQPLPAATYQLLVATPSPVLGQPIAQPEHILVPDVVGLQVASARRILAEASLESDERIESSSLPPGQVVRQEPVAGTRLAPGESVTLWLGSGTPVP
jgi:protein phosphatase